MLDRETEKHQKATRIVGSWTEKKQWTDRHAHFPVGIVKNLLGFQHCFARHRHDRRKPDVPFAAASPHPEYGKARYADRDRVLELRQVVGINWETMHRSLFERDPFDSREFFLRILPLRGHHFGGTVEGQLDAPIAQVLLLQVMLHFLGRGSTRLGTQRRKLRIRSQER